jgi:hypothetical protein
MCVSRARSTSGEFPKTDLQRPVAPGTEGAVGDGGRRPAQCARFTNTTSEVHGIGYWHHQALHDGVSRAHPQYRQRHHLDQGIVHGDLGLPDHSPPAERQEMCWAVIVEPQDTARAISRGDVELSAVKLVLESSQQALKRALFFASYLIGREEASNAGTVNTKTSCHASF